MFITKDILLQQGVCEQGLAFFNKHFPNGTDLMTLIHTHMPHSFLHWGYDHLPSTPEEKAAYYEALKVVDSTLVVHSDHVCQSSIVVNSSTVENAQRVFDSSTVTNSQYVSKSKYVSQSERVYNSSVVNDSARILTSTTVDHGTNICHSNYVLHSTNVFHSQNVINSHFIRNSTQVRDSAFCVSCKNIQNGFMCYNLQDTVYDQNGYIFNHEVSYNEFDMIRKQAAVLYNGFEAQFVADTAWPENEINGNAPVVHGNFAFHYEALTTDFFEWLTSLPFYDQNIVFGVTGRIK